MDNRRKVLYLKIGIVVGYVGVSTFFIFLLFLLIFGFRSNTLSLGSEEWMIHFRKTSQLESYMPIVFAFFLVGTILVNLCSKPYKRLKSGIDGEESTTRILDMLPTNYKVLSNITIEYEGSKSEIDNLIISPKGIAIIETKNYNGLTSGNENDLEWVITKTSGRGNNYTNTIKNPVKQVNRQVYILSQILKENGIRCWIDGYVFMAGGQCMTDSNKVYTDERLLLQTIMTSGKDGALSDSDINKIKQILSK